ncbi:tRNA (guanine-N(7)-)-methyltransferase [Acinetobacter towneri]|uniref:tRNA (guanine-N(7)-)-methyltransferase n=1 Tax=Acinetobacter towneri TaxID=202956 RepID=UPI001D0D715E|nr:tRNA (guanine-N(7)-)-methyltransferase [Acinetobacter towneri]
MIMPIRQFQAQRMHAPRDFQAIANESVCVEIGAGKGKHALLFSGQHPVKKLIAIERTREKFVAMQKQHQLEGQRNLQIVHADAIPWIVHALFPAQVEQFFILYPNPEPHNATQRWLNMPFFEFLLSRLKAGGSITLVSNIPEYIAEARQQLIEVWKLPFIQQDVPVDSARTHFEIKYLARGERCQELQISKPAAYTTRFDDFQPLQGQQPTLTPTSVEAKASADSSVTTE